MTVSSSDVDGSEAEPVITMLPAKKVARQLSPRHRLIAVVTTPKDTIADNIGLQAALKVDPQMARCAIQQTMYLVPRRVYLKHKILCKCVIFQHVPGFSTYLLMLLCKRQWMFSI